jgi:hypothetical protein
MKPTGEEILAIDVALVPPEWVQERARSVNAALPASHPEGFRFDATHPPHISLVQQFVRRSRLPALIEQFDPILRATPLLALRVLQIASRDLTVSFLVEPAPDLHHLHERLMDSARPYGEAGGAADAFYSGQEIPREMARENDVAWVANYRDQASYSNFIPHITLGVGTAPEPGEPFDFTADRAGLFHLGRFCTCRLLLHEWTLLPL